MESSTQALGDLLSNIRRLPPLPGGVARLMSLTPAAPGYYEEAVSIVRADPALATQALKIANSAMYAGQSTVSSVDRALMRVGARMIASTLAESHLKNTVDVRDEVSAHLWLVNALKANLCFTLAQRHSIGVNAEAAYTYGLLHDVGRLVLASVWRNAMQEIVEDDPHPLEGLIKSEEEGCGVTHTVAGRLLGNRWKLPPDVVLVAAAHHLDRTARASYPDDLNRAIELVALSEDCVHAAARGSSTPDAAATLVRERMEGEERAPRLEYLGLKPDQAADAIKPALAAVARQRRALGIGAAATGGRLPI